MMDRLRLFRWIDEFMEGNVDADDVKTQIKAGWYDWFCKDSSLANKTKKMGNIIKQVKRGGKVDLENWYVWFKNNCPMCGPLYDDMRFEPLKADHTQDERKDRYFVLCVKDNREPKDYMVWTERRRNNEFGADTTKEAFDFINDLVNDFKF